MENVTAEMIRAEFDFTADQITKKFKNTSGRVRKDMENKAKRLKNLGFGNTTEVREYKIIEDALKTIRKFSPYKFITEEAVEAICKKYGLLFGSSDRYLGDIPEKNLQEIEAFEAYQKEKEEKPKTNVPHDSDYPSISSFYADWGRAIGRTSGPVGLAQQLRDVFAPKYHIAAPITMMDHRESVLKDGYKIVDDPIVFKEVPGGYLIITAWGPEAQDPTVFNPAQN
tara:strand:- start:467 stop:1144 length:678 start_codon:yes stop_codon:yes gene_type:complete